MYDCVCRLSGRTSDRSRNISARCLYRLFSKPTIHTPISRTHTVETTFDFLSTNCRFSTSRRVCERQQHLPIEKQIDSKACSSNCDNKSEDSKYIFDNRSMWKSSSKPTTSTKRSSKNSSTVLPDPVSDFWTSLNGGGRNKANRSVTVDTRDAIEDTTSAPSSLVYEESVEVEEGSVIAGEQNNSSELEDQFVKDPTIHAVSTSFTGVAKMFGSLMKNSSKDEKQPTVQYCNMIAEESQTATFLNTAKNDGMESPLAYILQFIKNNSSGGKPSNGQNKHEQIAITDVIAQIQQRVEHVDHGEMDDPNSLKEIYGMFQQYKDLMKKVAMKYVGNIDFKRLTPTAIFYYLEREDEVKNPSWKRRQHRFFPGIDMSEVQNLNDACDIALLSYADTVEEIRQGLFNNKRTPYELLYSELRSATGQPANFVAVKVDANVQNSKMTNRKKIELDVIIVVRGTKTAADAFTDLLCESEPYQGGRAHSFIVTSGIYIADKHRSLLLELLDRSGASVINLTLIGHSLGAGAASIAGMEFNNEKGLFYSPKIKAKVIGFGCPALVSEDLAKKSGKYITTVINDSDVVPRLSGISVANMLNKVLQFDWREYAKKDIQMTLNEFEKSQPLLFRSGGVTRKTIQSLIESLLDKYSKDFIVTETKAPHLPVELYPPGKCIHFYNDGRGISANYVPNTFFDEIDVTRRMVDDHLFFTGYQGTFLAVARQHTKNHHFRFDIPTDS